MPKEGQPEGRRKTLSEIVKEKALDKGQVYRVRWEGGKLPPGLLLNNHVITEVKDGEILAVKSDDPSIRTPVGTYDRIVEFGGEHKDEQEIVLYLSADPTTPPTFDTSEYISSDTTQHLNVNRLAPEEALKLTLSSPPPAGNA